MRILQDPHGRTFTYLRLSLTEACNFRCRYCLPHGYLPRAKSAGGLEDTALTVAEIENLVRAFAELGFSKVRLSGGEPTLRPDIVHIVQCLSDIGGIETVALTTNGYRLEKLAKTLAAAGLTAVNVSLDSLNHKHFNDITGMPLASRVLFGVEAALSAGIDRVKINVVALRSYLQGDFDDFVDFVRSRPITVRFIELMETSDNGDFFHREHLSGDLLRSRLRAAGWQPVVRGVCAGPAEELRHPDYQGRLGVIAPYSKDFCLRCNRLRVSSRGTLRLCLFGDGEHSLRHLLRSPEQRADLIREIQLALQSKAVGHRLHEGVFGRTANLASIGG